MENSTFYGVTLKIRPTGGLTFRRLPSAILHISTYPFMPPSTMSGWLRRLYFMSNGVFPETKVKKPDYYVMPPEFHVLGAYPMHNQDNQKCYHIHTTKRHGVRAFNHNAFSRITGGRTTHEVYQLHTWEYLFVDLFQGIVLHKKPEVLELMKTLVNHGCKCGKEGFAYLDMVSDVTEYSLTQSSGRPTVPATGEELIGKPADLFLAYRHEFDEKYKTDLDPSQLEVSQVKGFVPTWLGWPDASVELEYLTDNNHLIPAGMVEIF